ncbi:MAG: cellulase family glycosylhydrolase [Lachnospiraceae bacterium]|nr:cellulase family glycosylhydrolase [Lachnospiraceae bacterium]
MKESVKQKIIAFSVIGILGLLVLGLSIRLVLILQKNSDENNRKSGQKVTVTQAVPENTPSSEPTPTENPDISGTPEPDLSPEPTEEPTQEPTKEPTAEPTKEPTKAPDPTPTPTTAPEPTKAPNPGNGKTPFELHGKLNVSGTKILDQNGREFQLKGVSTHGLQWFPQYVNEETFRTIRDDWGANVIRLAMYTDENGYCTGGPTVKKNLRELIDKGVKLADKLGMYVIIDWHILHDLTPVRYQDEALSFFEDVSKQYGSYGNVIYEICNEPNGGTSWNEIKGYAEKVIPIIRKNAGDAIVIVGTPTWSQDVDQAANNPIKGTNIMYALHFYAGTHKDNLRQKMNAAVRKGLPVFVSEFGITDASGNGRCDIDEANKWVVLMDELKISYVCWNLANKNESSSLIRAGVNKLSGFTKDDLSTEGNWLISVLHGNLPVTPEQKEEILNNAGQSGGEGMPDAISFTQKTDKGTVSLITSNTWMEGSKYCYQLSLEVKNTTAADLNGWSFTFSCDRDADCSNFWCCKFKKGAKSFTLSEESWNGRIAKGASISDAGFILKCDGPLKITGVK